MRSNASGPVPLNPERVLTNPAGKREELVPPPGFLYNPSAIPRVESKSDQRSVRPVPPTAASPAEWCEMPTDATTEQLGSAIRESGLYTPDQLKAAEAALSGGAQSAADKLLELRVLTNYQYRKIRAGRANDLLFGPYLILDKIGEGGMGKVYRAVQQRVGRLVALKTIRPHLMANKTVLKRYKREAQAAAALNHPNIVTLYDADEIEGRYFLSMEYVDGIDLSRMVKEFGKPPFRGLDSFQEVCEYVRQTALGLQHAHEHGLVHRDIKPGNLLVFGERALPDTGGKATVKILDMGLVRSIFDGDDVSRTELTRDGTVVGTPDYMAPEQAKNSSTVDPRADLYALGCTLYYMFRGQPPFPDGSPIDKLLRHQLDPPPDIRQVRPDLPPGVVHVIERLLQKRPEDRIQTAAEVAHLLTPFSSTANVMYAPAARAVPAATSAQTVPFAADPNTPSHPDQPAVGLAGRPSAATLAPSQTAAHNVAGFAPTMTLPPNAPAPVQARAVRGLGSNPAMRPVSSNSGSHTPLPVPVSAPIVVPELRSTAAASELPAFGDSQRLDGELIRVANRERKKKKSTELHTKPESKLPIAWIVAGVAVFGCILIAVAAVLLARGDGEKTQNSAPATTPSTETKPPAVSVSYPHLPAGSLLLPPDTKAALTIFPKAFLARYGIKTPRDAKNPAALENLADYTGFDARICDRITIAFPSRQPPIALRPNSGPETFDYYRQPFIVIGEGPFLTENWVRDLDKIKSLNKPPYGAAQSLLVAPAPLANGTPHRPGYARFVVGVLGTQAFALSTQSHHWMMFSNITEQLKKTKFPDPKNAPIASALPNPADKNLPYAKFVAGPDWPLVEHEQHKKLSDYNITLLTITLRPGVQPSDLEVVLTLHGEREKFMSFLAEYGKALLDNHDEVRPLLEALKKGEHSSSRNGGEDVLKITAKWSWPDLSKAIDELGVEGIREEIRNPAPIRPTKEGPNPFIPGKIVPEPTPKKTGGEEARPRKTGGFGETFQRLFGREKTGGTKSKG